MLATQCCCDECDKASFSHFQGHEFKLFLMVKKIACPCNCGKSWCCCHTLVIKSSTSSSCKSSWKFSYLLACIQMSKILPENPKMSLALGAPCLLKREGIQTFLLWNQIPVTIFDEMTENLFFKSSDTFELQLIKCT